VESSNQLKKRHQMHEFGTVHGATRGIRVNRLERRLTPLVPFPHRHDFYHLVVVLNGGGWHEIDFHRHAVQPHQVFFMKPGQVHSWKINKSSKGYIIEFGSDATDLRFLSEMPDRLRLSNRVADLVKFMLDEYERQATDFEALLRHYLAVLLIELARGSAGKKKSTHGSDPLLDRFLELIEEQFRKEHRVEFYAQRLKTTPKALTMRASRALGQSARAVIQNRCLLEVQRLLAYSNLTIAEIGYELGFEDPNYFSRFFRTLSKSTPGDFRDKVKSLSLVRSFRHVL
jgi:AraC-like DNA-binding protein